MANIDQNLTGHSQLGMVGEITASTDEDVDRIIEEVEADKLNVDKVGRSLALLGLFSNFVVFQISRLALSGVTLYDRQIVALVQIIRWGVGTTVIHSHWSRAIEILGSDWARSVLYDTVIRDFLWVGTVGTLTIKVTSTSI